MRPSSPNPDFSRRAFLSGTAAFTIAELLVSLFVLTLIVLSVTAIFAAAGRMTERSRAEARLFSEGLSVMNRIQRGESGLWGLMKARSDSAVVSQAGAQIDFSADKNDDYTSSTADDVAMRIFFDDGDGNAATLDDNTVVLDPDTAAAGATIPIGRNVEELNFAVAGDVVTVSVVLADTVRGETIRIAASRDILMRN